MDVGCNVLNATFKKSVNNISFINHNDDLLIIRWYVITIKSTKKTELLGMVKPLYNKNKPVSYLEWG